MVFQKGNNLGVKFQKGHIITDEHKQKISDSNSGVTFTDDHKRKIGEANLGKIHNWKGGRNLSGEGYILIYKPEHPFCYKAGYVAEHRLAMEEFLGRYLEPAEVIHHINEIRNDNRLENLMLFATCGEHIKYHRKLKKWSRKGVSDCPTMSAII